MPEKTIHLWKGFCVTHHRVRKADVEKALELHPDAVLLIHPECRPEVVEMADFVGSTSQIIEYARNSSAKKFIIGTEMGILHQLNKENPDKQFFLLSQGMVCPNMKKTTAESVYNALKHMRYRIELEPDIIQRAQGALEAMLKV